MTRAPMHYLLPPEVAGEATAEVFEVFRVVTQPELPATNDQPAVPACTTVRLRGVDTGREIAIGLPDLAQLGEPITTREDDGDE
jgi:hypothetical protein